MLGAAPASTTLDLAHPAIRRRHSSASVGLNWRQSSRTLIESQGGGGVPRHWRAEAARRLQAKRASAAESPSGVRWTITKKG